MVFHFSSLDFGHLFLCVAITASSMFLRLINFYSINEWLITGIPSSMRAIGYGIGLISPTLIPGFVWIVLRLLSKHSCQFAFVYATMCWQSTRCLYSRWLIARAQARLIAFRESDNNGAGVSWRDRVGEEKEPGRAGREGKVLFREHCWRETVPLAFYAAHQRRCLGWRFVSLPTELPSHYSTASIPDWNTDSCLICWQRF